jgi:hypothetical protein
MCHQPNQQHTKYQQHRLDTTSVRVHCYACLQRPQRHPYRSSKREREKRHGNHCSPSNNFTCLCTQPHARKRDRRAATTRPCRQHGIPAPPHVSTQHTAACTLAHTHMCNMHRRMSHTLCHCRMRPNANQRPSLRTPLQPARSAVMPHTMTTNQRPGAHTTRTNAKRYKAFAGFPSLHSHKSTCTHTEKHKAQ